MYWIVMSERSDEYEASTDDLSVLVSELELSFDSGSAIAESPPVIEVALDRHADESSTDDLVVPTRLGLLINGKVNAVFDNQRCAERRAGERRRDRISDRPAGGIHAVNPTGSSVVAGSFRSSLSA